MYKAIKDNKRNTIIIMMMFVIIIGVIGWFFANYFGEASITFYVIVFALIYTILQFFIADKLTIASTGAKQIEKKDNPRLYRIVENLSITTGMDMPKVYIINDSSLNAFATGRDPKHAIVAATTGLVDSLDDNELEAVMAHEMGHIANYDIRLSMIVFGLVSIIGILSDLGMRIAFRGERRENGGYVTLVVGLVAVILAPIVATIVQMAVSRQREYLADATSSMTTRNPDALISALHKISLNSRPMSKQSPAASHIFFANPLKPGFLSKLFSTHPPIEERIKRLSNNSDKF